MQWNLQGRKRFKGGRGSKAEEVRERKRFKGGRGSKAEEVRRRMRFESGRGSKAEEVRRRKRLEGGRGSKAEEVRRRKSFKGGRGSKAWRATARVYAQNTFKKPKTSLPTHAHTHKCIIAHLYVIIFFNYFHLNGIYYFY